MSFWLDWWLLLGFGIVNVGIAKQITKLFNLNEYWNEWVKRGLYVLSIAIFLILSVGLLGGFTMGTYNFDNPGTQIGPTWLATINDWFFGIIRWFYGPYYEMHPEAASTEFMFSSGQQWLRNVANIDYNKLQQLANHPYHLFVGVIIFCLYPYLLHLGFQLGDMLWGSKPGREGMFRMAWGFIMILALIIVPILMGFSLQNTILPVWAWIIILEVAIIVIFYGDFILVQKKKD